jgi:hypothetical protein
MHTYSAMYTTNIWIRNIISIGFVINLIFLFIIKYEKLIEIIMKRLAEFFFKEPGHQPNIQIYIKRCFN